jgi:hypothetical protein
VGVRAKTPRSPGGTMFYWLLTLVDDLFTIAEIGHMPDPNDHQ